MPMTNRGNRWIYRLWAPVYDPIVGWFSAAGRRRTVATLAARPGQRILVPGVGTGADLPALPEGITVIGVDLSLAMLARAQARLPLAGKTIMLICADVQALPLCARSCDAGLLSLIVSVAPDGGACIREAARVVRADGSLVIFDKFLPDGARPGMGRRLLNGLAHWLGTDVNRRLGDLLAGSGCTVIADQPAGLGGAYRTIVATVPAHAGAACMEP